MYSLGARNTRWRSLLLACGGIAAAALAAGDGPLPEGSLQPLDDAYLAEVRPLMERYCHDCHNADLAEAEIDLTRFATLADVRQDARTWARVGEMLESGQMPPEDGEQPSDEERETLQTWVHDVRMVEARAQAGDPGRVVLRRLSNAEYTYTIRDLTGVDSLDPAREFPVDGAAGEGFTNTGGALVMSPSLVTKYLDAAKEIASHAVLVPDGIRFSPYTSSRDWTDETLAEIRAFYAEFSKTGASDPLVLQGVPIDSPERGQLPLEKYLAATLTARERLAAGATTIEDVALESKLNPRYLAALWDALTGAESSLVLDGLRARWRTATPAGAASLAAYVEQWQKALWKFNSIGHIGAVGAPSRWQEAVSPLVAEQEIRYSIPAAADGGEVTLSLVASDAGDGNEHDVVVWHNPRLAAPGRPDLPLREVRRITQELTALRERVFSQTAACLKAVDVAAAAEGGVDVPELARRHSIDVESLQAWLDLLGVGVGSPVELEGHFTSQLRGVGGHEFINGWGADATPLVLANSSDELVRVPGAVKPHGIVVHPSPTMQTAVAWRSPIGGAVRIEAAVSHAHPECGNGVAWTLELRRGTTRRRLAAGVAHGAAAPVIDPLDGVSVQPGDVVMLLIAARDGDHSCDLTAVDLKITDGTGQEWDLAKELSGDVLAANPRADRFGHDAVWHFVVQSEEPGTTAPVIPADSLLAQWQSAATAEEKIRLAAALQQLLTDGVPAGGESPDAALYRELASLRGPLFQQGMAEAIADVDQSTASDADADAAGLVPAMFGKHPEGGEIDANSLCVQAPSVMTVRLPAELAAGCELVATGRLDETVGAEGSVQLRVVPGAPASADGLLAGEVQLTDVAGMWTSDNRLLSHSAPIVVANGSAARRRLESAFDDFRQIFPAALCYTKIVPIDEVVTLTLLYREDDHLVRLMLDQRQRERLDRLWAELRFVSRDPLKMVDALEQLIEFATQDADPSKLEPLRQPTAERAAAFQQALVDAEPKQVAALLEFAARAWRRPLSADETRDLQKLYDALRAEELPHEEALRLTLARVLVAPAFLYRVETPPPGEKPGAVADGELAARLSYFLWSSLPDAELRQVTAAGRLREPEILLGQTRRMLRDAKTRRLAIEFGCQWLHIKDFDRLDEKSERHFPTFVGLRGAMYEESVQFFADLFQNNRSVLDILDADYTFLNQELASHYGIPGVSGPEWRRVDGVRQFSRGGVLAQATTLATQAGASRTSPILRGNWISEVLVGQRLPRPPKGVPPLPDDGGVAEGLTVRQLVEKHVSDPNCAVCHRRIDPFGFSLEAFDAIGRYRETDAGNLPIDAHVKTADGAEFTGLDGLRSYLLTERRDDFVRQFCRKLLGYALGRGVELSDEELLEAMQSQLAANNYEVVSAVEAIVASPQFREIRGRDRVDEAAAGDLHVKDEP